MKTLNSIKTTLVCVASAITLACLGAYVITGMWHLLIIAIAACAVGLTLKEENTGASTKLSGRSSQPAAGLKSVGQVK